MVMNSDTHTINNSNHGDEQWHTVNNSNHGDEWADMIHMIDALFQYLIITVIFMAISK